MSSERMLRTLLGDEAVDALMREDASHPLLQGDATWIEDLLIARLSLPLPPVPPLVSQNLRDVFDRHLLARHYEAVLVSDSRQARQLQGVRGGRTDDDGWSLSYSCEAADILLDVWPNGPTIDIDGQVMTHGGEAVAFNASIVGLANGTVNSDELGRFRLTELAPQSYEMVLSNRRAHIVLHPDLRPEAS